MFGFLPVAPRVLRAHAQCYLRCSFRQTRKRFPLSDTPPGNDAMVQLMREHVKMMNAVVPWARAVGFKVNRIEPGHIWGVQPWAGHLVGEAETGIIHGGVITTFLDNLSGMACNAALKSPRFVATIDLRIDYMRPAEPGRDIIGEAECYHVTRTVCFTRAWAYHESRDKVIATSAGTFALGAARLGEEGGA
jgi:uncharacterized protein (TIGR00369 family)